MLKSLTIAVACSFCVTAGWAGDLAQCEKKDAQSCLKAALDAHYGTNGVKQDEKRAVRLYKKACQLGKTDACIWGGETADGWKTAAGTREANALYDLACKKGHAVGCLNLGRAYREGHGVKKNQVTALSLWKKGCDLKNAASCFNLAAEAFSEPAQKRDMKAVVRYTRLACDYGEPDGCTNLGIMTMMGEGVEQNPQKAVEIWRRACIEAQSGASCMYYGNALWDGAGVKQDVTLAGEMLKKSCDLHFGDGCDQYSQYVNWKQRQELRRTSKTGEAQK